MSEEHTTMSTSPLLTLPTEITHRIIDYLDDKTTLFSLQYVCKRLYTIVKGYNQYRLDFRSISKSQFQQICKFIGPQNIISLILSDGDETPGQIGLFLSLFSIHDFTRLRSLTLIQVEESHLIIFLKHIPTCPLVSLSIDHQDTLNLSYETIALHSSAIANLHLHTLHLTTANCIIINIKLPAQCPIQYLTLNRCSCKQYIHILRHLSHLQTLVLTDFSTNDSDDTFASLTGLESSPQIKSLTIKQDLMSINKIRTLVSLTSSLVHLKLVSLTGISDSIYDGLQWEQFIQTKLPYLDKFEFFFSSSMNENRTNHSIKRIIAPFRTSFWLEYKFWFVNCTYEKDGIFELFSVPVCESSQIYASTKNKISYSTLPMSNAEESLMDNVSDLHVNLNEALIDNISEQNERSKGPLYRKLTKLSLRFSNSCPQNSNHYLSLLIDISYLVQLSVKSFPIVRDIIGDLLQRAYNVHTLHIDGDYLDGDYEGQVKRISLILPNKVKHVKVNVENYSLMIFILQKTKQLSSVTFKTPQNRSNQYDEVISWLNGRDFTYRKHNSYLGLWFGRNT